jgi:hypothetical protein
MLQELSEYNGYQCGFVVTSLLIVTLRTTADVFVMRVVVCVCRYVRIAQF